MKYKKMGCCAKKMTPDKAEMEIMQIIKGKHKISKAPKVYKVSKWAQEKFEGKRNPPRLMSYGEFVDKVEQRRSELKSELRRRG
jgi:hypothetical protein